MLSPYCPEINRLSGRGRCAAKAEKPAMTADEQLKLKKELTAARDRQAPKSKAKDGATHAEPVKP